MKSCTIVIPHLETLDFLRACIRWVEYQKNSKIHQEIIIVDDNSQDGSYQQILKDYGAKYRILQTFRRDKTQNVGFALDLASQFINTDYVCTIDADCIPMSDQWLIKPIEKVDSGFFFVGRNSGHDVPYMDYMKNNPDKQKFIIIDNCYRVCTTANYKLIAKTCSFQLRHYDAIDHYLSTYTPFIGKADNGVAANYYVYTVLKQKSYPYGIPRCIGVTPTEGSFGQSIEDLLFHMALATRFLSKTRKNLNTVGAHYESYLKQIAKYGLTDELVSKMFSDLKPN